MKDLIFCPKCGLTNSITVENSKIQCNSCDFTLFHNVAATSTIIIKCGDEILFTIRNQEPATGKLDLPGGFVDSNETLEEAGIREIYEELGLKLDSSKLKYLCSYPNTYLYKDISYNLLDAFFIYEIDKKPEIKLDLKELQGFIWVPLTALNFDDALAFESQKKLLRNLNNYLK